MGVEGGNKESLRSKEAGETAAAPPQRTPQSSNIPPPSIYNNLETDGAPGPHPRGTSFTSSVQQSQNPFYSPELEQPSLQSRMWTRGLPAGVDFPC